MRQIRSIARSLTIVVGIILVWRGIWYVLDILDERLFGGQHIVTAIGGIIAGLVLLYVPDRDLKEIEKI